MTVELITENGKIVNIVKDGKKVKASYVRGLRKAQESWYWSDYAYPQTFANHFSGVQATLTAFESSIYNWCMRWYRLYSTGNPDAPIQTYDDMKYLLLELNPQAYYDLLD